MLLWVAAAHAATLDVGEGRAFGLLQDAIDAAGPGDVLRVHDREHRSCVHVGPSASVQVKAVHPGTVLTPGEDCGDLAMLVEGQATVEGFTLSRALGPALSVEVQGTLELRAARLERVQLTVEGWLTLEGGELHSGGLSVNSSATAHLSRAVLKGSPMSANEGATLRIQDSEIHDLTGDAVVALGSTLTLERTTVRDVRALDTGFAPIHCERGPCTVSDSVFERNGGQLAGVVYVGPGAQLTWQRNRACSNEGMTHGGVITVLQGRAAVADSLFVDNWSAMAGGTFFVQGGLDAERITVLRSRTDGEGAVVQAGQGQVGLSHSVFVGSRGNGAFRWRRPARSGATTTCSLTTARQQRRRGVANRRRAIRRWARANPAPSRRRRPPSPRWVHPRSSRMERELYVLSSKP